MAITFPLIVTVTVNGVSGLPKDYFVLTRSDGGLTFHLGALGDLTKAPDPLRPYNLGLHHVKITDSAGAILFDQDIAGHWWNSRWTYRPNALKAVVPTGRMFPMGDTGKPTGNVFAYAYKGPMDSAGVTTYMPTTGERPDIGLVTDPSALFMLTGNAGPMLAWAQAGNTCPGHYRDEATGKPIDLLKYPVANDYNSGNQGTPQLLQGPKNAAGYSGYGGGWVPQQAHYCEMSYMAYCATQDETFLEDLQYSANFVVLNDAYLSAQLHKATVRGEPRGIAWALRELFMAHVATQDAEKSGKLPASCHPSSYWKTLLDQSLAYYDKARTDPTNQLFHLIPSGTQRFAPWQHDYQLSALGYGVLTGHSDWAPLYLFALKNAIDRTSGKSGYPPGWGGAYALNVYEWKKNPDGTYDQTSFDMTKPLDWNGSFLFQQNDPNGAQPTAAEIATLTATPFNKGVGMKGGEYLMTTRAVLVQAQYLDDAGICKVRQAYPDLDACASAASLMVKNNPAPINARQSYITGPVTPPTPIPPTPTPIPPTPTPTPPVMIPKAQMDAFAADISAALKKAGY